MGGSVGSALGTVSKTVSEGYGSITGANAGAEAAQGIANAQLGASQQQLDFEKQSRNQALQFAAPTFDELQQVHQQYQLQSDLLSRQIDSLTQYQAIANSIDPSIKAAAQQATNLLSGQQASILDPIKQERQLQKNQLENQLRDQLGSGFAATTAGQEALNRFDQETASTMASAQQSAIQTAGQYLGVASNSRPNMVGLNNGAFQAVSQLGLTGNQLQNQIDTRQINAITGTPVDFSNVIGNAGAPFTQSMYNANAQQRLFGQLSNFGLAQLMGPAGQQQQATNPNVFAGGSGSNATMAGTGSSVFSGGAGSAGGGLFDVMGSSGGAAAALA